MNVQQFEFRDGATGWHLAGARFEAFELLVGRSGAGKTRIIEALRRVQRFAVDAAFAPGAMTWTLVFQHGGASYTWEGATELTAAHDTRVVRERLARDGQVLAERVADAIAVRGRALPASGRAGSLLGLIVDEPDVAQAAHALRRVVFAEREAALSLRCARETQTSIEQAIRAIAATRAAIEDKLEDKIDDQREPARKRSWRAFLEQAAATPTAARFIAPIQEIVARLDRLAWLYALQELGASERAEIEALFVRIFPFVAALRVFWAPPGAPDAEVLELAIREQGVDHWIPAPQMAASMRRALGVILDAMFAPSASVLVIDDLESDLGVDVLPAVVTYLQSRVDCQILATSRHPYILDQVPVTAWRLVRRRGNEVCTDAVTSLPGYDVEPRHRAFHELLELAELEEQVS
jgi:hypothetical protein